MHRNPSVTKKSLAFFGYVAVAAFVWEWFPEYMFPLLASLPLICWMGHGNPIAYVLGSGYYGFGILDLSLDWNYISGVMQPMYTPLWSNAHQFAGVFFAVWFLYPILYYTNTFQGQTFAAVSSNTFDSTGAVYNISAVLTPDYRLNQTAMDAHSKPYWSVSYVFYVRIMLNCVTWVREIPPADLSCSVLLGFRCFNWRYALLGSLVR